jgi:hypothetical protein
MAQRGSEMVRSILDIGSGRYEFDKQTLTSFIEEAKSHPSGFLSVGVTVADESAPLGDTEREQAAQDIFAEVMSLYHGYISCQNLDLLVKLKNRLEEYSIKYQSHVLAEGVLNINSCLPYELRIPVSGGGDGSKGEDR